MALESLSLTVLPPSGRNPLDARRNKTIARLESSAKLSGIHASVVNERKPIDFSAEDS